jgi:hypothetical protein
MKMAKETMASNPSPLRLLPVSEEEEYDDASPFISQRYTSKRRNTHTLRRVQRVSRHAALTTKQQLWDSNDASIDAALSAVDQWEGLYNAARGLLLATAHSAKGLYGATKQGAGSLEHGILVPVRDWILLPAFGGVEKATSETAKFLQSDQAKVLAEQSLEWAKQVPFGVGENVLAPCMCFSVGFLQRTWQIAQYPIPSKQQVRHSVDFALTGAKWALTTAGREIIVYIKRADANITRTLSHTQWKVLGSGPYATLDKLNKREVIDHLCERYFSLTDSAVARYELAAHVRVHNRPLYHDLVLTGVLQQRGGDLTKDDEWLSTCPAYRALDDPFLIAWPTVSGGDDEKSTAADGLKDAAAAAKTAEMPARTAEVAPLWFRLPYINGKRPARDVPWICFRGNQQLELEQRYRQILHDGQTGPPATVEDSTTTTANSSETTGSTDPNDLLHDGQASPAPAAENSTTTDSGEATGSTIPNDQNRSQHQPLHVGVDGNIECESESPGLEQDEGIKENTAGYPTIAKWYVPKPDIDVLVDQQRHAVSFFACCPRCRQPQTSTTIPPMVQTSFGDLCQECSKQAKDMPMVAALLSPSPITAIMRPTFWRFHGPGDDVRRAAWVLDTPRNGLQPFDEDAQAILEDAYLFLKWMSVRQESYFESDDLDSALLTVEVPCPDGTERLVQFSSLTQATAIQKGLGAAVALFKRRVYRGAWLEKGGSEQVSVEDSILQSAEDNGTLGDTLVPNASMRSVVTPIGPESRIVVYSGNDPVAASMAVPPSRMSNEDMTKLLEKEKEGNIDHLVLIVHGIGEMLRSSDVFGLSLPNLSSIIDCCANLRRNHAEVQDAHFSQMYPTVDAVQRESTGRVEYLPVEWHEAFSILSQRRSTSPDEKQTPGVMLKDISLRTIPNMRDFANDTLMDVLYFMSPVHHDIIIDIVTHEMNTVVERFCQLTGFEGRISVVGHSLGSIVSWDILNNQNTELEDDDDSDEDSYSRSFDSTSEFESAKSEDYHPELTSSAPPSSQVQSSYPQLDFTVDNFFLLGSPVAVFLMIRNQRQPLTADFHLSGCKRVFNIFHPYDPIAYRMEPCIDPRNADFEPMIVKHWNGGFRVQYQTKRLWRKFVDTTWKTQQTVVEAFESSMAQMGLLDTAAGISGEDDDDDTEFSSDDHNRGTYVVCGLLNRGRRIDYMLQEKEVENASEYVAALGAHSSYWIERDLSLFFARQSKFLVKFHS